MGGDEFLQNSNPKVFRRPYFLPATYSLSRPAGEGWGEGGSTVGTKI